MRRLSLKEPNPRSQNSTKLRTEQADRSLLYGLSFVSFLFMLGFGIALPSLPVAVEHLGYSELDAGLVISIWALAYVATGVPAGALLDAHDLKAIIPATMAGNGLVGLAFVFGASLPPFIMGRLVQGILESFVWTGIFGLVSFKYAHLRASALGILSGFSSLGFSIGPLLNSVFLASAPVRVGLVPFVVTSLASAILTALLFRSRRVYYVGGERKPLSIRDTIRSLNSVAIVTLVMMIILGGFDAIVQAQNLDILASSGLSAALSGVLLSSYYVSTLANRSLLTYTHRFVERASYPALSFLGALLVLLAGNIFVRTSYTLALQWIVLGTLLGVNWISSQALIAQIVGEKAPSTAMGIYSLSWGSGYLIMPPLVGFVAILSGGPVAYVFLEILVTIGLFSAIAFLLLRRHERVP
jgi:DHA1 family multidrug resistance protein-like MFS transporter